MALNVARVSKALRYCGRKRMKVKASAFTLVEVLLVLIIVLVLASLIMPAVNKQLDEATFKSEVWDLRDRIVNGRAEALINSSPVDFHYTDAHIRWEANGVYRGDYYILIKSKSRCAEIIIHRITNQVKVSKIWTIK
jgi:Tfp pilus assembly protein FimT